MFYVFKTGIKVMVKTCLRCHTQVRFQEYSSGFHNFNNKVFLSIPLCSMLSTAIKVSINVLLEVQHTLHLFEDWLWVIFSLNRTTLLLADSFRWWKTILALPFLTTHSGRPFFIFLQWPITNTTSPATAVATTHQYYLLMQTGKLLLTCQVRPDFCKTT